MRRVALKRTDKQHQKVPSGLYTQTVTGDEEQLGHEEAGQGGLAMSHRCARQGSTLRTPSGQVRHCHASEGHTQAGKAITTPGSGKREEDGRGEGTAIITKMEMGDSTMWNTNKNVLSSPAQFC